MFAAQSETLKYLFLLFSDGDTIPLSSELGKKKPTCESAPQLIVCLTFAEYVFNTEVRRCPVISFDASSLTCHLTRIGPPASNFQSLHPNRFHLNAPVHVYTCLLIYDQDYYLMSSYIIIRRTVNFVTLKLDSNRMGNHYKGYVFNRTTKSKSHNGKRYTDKIASHGSVQEKKRVVYDSQPTHNDCSSLGRLGHNLSIRKYLTRFVVAPSTRDILPRFVRHVTIRIVQRNDVLDWRQKLKLSPL